MEFMEVEVMLSNFDGRDRVSVKEFLSYAALIVEEDAFIEGKNYKPGVNESILSLTFPRI